MKHLDKAGYIFGVDYHGDPVVCDARGHIRKIHFDCAPKKNAIPNVYARLRLFTQDLFTICRPNQYFNSVMKIGWQAQENGTV